MPRETRRIGLALVVVSAVATGLTLLSRTAGDHGAGSLATQDPGALVQVSATVARLLMGAAATLTVGSLAYVVLCTSPTRSRRFGPMVTLRAHHCLGRASRWAGVWLVAALLGLVATAASDSGLDYGELHGASSWFRLAANAPQSSYWLATAAVAATICLLARRVTLWRNVAPVLVLAVLGLLPPLFAGHASSDTDHDLATGAIALHVPAAALWVGLLVVVLLESAAPGGPDPGVVRRYWRVSTICWIVLGASGLLLGDVLDPQHTVSTPYGRVLAAKVVLFAVLGGTCLWGRRRVALSFEPPADGTRAALPTLGRLCVVELGLLATLYVASAQLTSLSPPAFALKVTIQQTLLGYRLAGPPTIARLLLDWRLEVLLVSVAAMLAIWYVVMWGRLRARGGAWPVSRLVSWLAGCGVVVVATSSGLGRYEPAMFSVHMAGHMLLATVAPMLLALGGPLTLARECLDASAAPASRRPRGGLPGAEQWLDVLEDSPAVRWLTHPVIALGLLVWVPFLVYFGGVFDHAAKYHWAHMLLDVFFLAAGYLVAWTVIGVDRTPRPLPSLARLGVLLAAMPFDALFSGLVMSSRHVIGDGLSASNMYSALSLPWVHSLLADQRAGGLLSLVIGEAALLGAMVVLVLRWWRLDEPLFDVVVPTRRHGAAQPQAVGDHEQ